MGGKSINEIIKSVNFQYRLLTWFHQFPNFGPIRTRLVLGFVSVSSKQTRLVLIDQKIVKNWDLEFGIREIMR